MNIEIDKSKPKPKNSMTINLDLIFLSKYILSYMLDLDSLFFYLV